MASPTEKYTLEVDGRVLTLTNRHKVLWPADGITKGDLVAYYRRVAPYVLHHVARRPLTVERYPNGIDGPSFFEKNVSKGAPPWVETVPVPSDSGKRDVVRFMLCNDEATLLYVANLAAIVLHVWTSQAGSLDVPDFVFFDLDPFDGCTLATLAKTALALRELLDSVGLETLVKTSGGSGLHVVVPLEAAYGYDICKGFAEIVARTLHARLPTTTTLERMQAKRPAGTVYLDYVQVGKGKTYVAPFSVRPRDTAPVSMPIGWGEVEAMRRKRAKETMPEMTRWTIANVPELLAASGDPWAEGWTPHRLETAISHARTLWA